MSHTVGKLTVCNRCGKKHFSKRIQDAILDGGYTHAERFEALPDGWDYRKTVGDLCPDCAAALDTMIENFMQEI